jgi:hypothetical protein
LNIFFPHLLPADGWGAGFDPNGEGADVDSEETRNNFNLEFFVHGACREERDLAIGVEQVDVYVPRSSCRKKDGEVLTS